MFDEKLKILTSVLGNFYRSNNELLFYCPHCEHHKRKLSINIEKNAFKCWVCDYKGKDIYRVVRRFGDHGQKQDWRALTNTVDVENFTTKLFDAPTTIARNKLDLPSDFKSLVNKKNPPTAIYPLNYLSSRGVSKEDIIRWKIGYCEEGDFSGRVVVPSFDNNGDISYFVARSYDHTWPKYLNPQDVDKNIIFNELFLDFDDDLVLVEGVFDAIVAGNAVPLLGSSLRENSKLVQQIVKHDTPVYLALDPDAKAKEQKIAKMFMQYDIELYKVDVSGFDDVGEMTKEEFKNCKRNAAFIKMDNYLLYEALNAI